MHTQLTANEIIETLELERLIPEGGFFKRTYASEVRVTANGKDRHGATAIYYLLTPDTFAALHRVKSDEMFHFYEGDPVELVFFHQRKLTRQILGHDLRAGQRPQCLVPANAWQGARIIEVKKAYSLLGTTVSPGFEFDDFEMGSCLDIQNLGTEAKAAFEVFIRSSK